MDQICFQAEGNGCPQFESNPFAKSGLIVRKCTHCSNDISLHQRVAVSAASIQKVLESNAKTPSEILPFLYLGGANAAINLPFLSDHNISLVVNAAKGLEQHFPKFRTVTLAYIKLNISAVELQWIDSHERRLDKEAIRAVILTMDQCLESGRSVLCHCAQGKNILIEGHVHI